MYLYTLSEVNSNKSVYSYTLKTKNIHAQTSKHKLPLLKKKKHTRLQPTGTVYHSDLNVEESYPNASKEEVILPNAQNS